MKFYFCEKCGTRLTEEAIERGEGRDKKLGGIYCKDCAVGVMTMEFPKLNEMDARRILEAPPTPNEPTPPPAAKPRGKRGKSDKREPLGAYGRVPGKPKEERGGMDGFVAAVAAGVVLLAVGLVVALSGSPRPPTQAAQNETSAPEAKPLPTAAPAPKPTPIPEALPPVATNKPAAPAQANAPEEPVASTEPPAEPQPEVAEAPQPASEPNAPAEPKPPAPAEATPIEASTPPADPASEPAPPDLKPALKALVAALKRGGLLAARNALSQPPIAGQPAAEPLGDAVAALEAEAKAFIAAAEQAKGQSFRWGAHGGRLTALKDQALVFERDIMINGEARGTTQTHEPLDEIPDAVRKQIYDALPTTLAGWFAHALEGVAAGAIPTAEAAAAKCAGHPLHQPLLGLLADARTAAREADARTQWTALVEQAQARLSVTQAKKALQKLEVFEADFSGTSFLQETDYQSARKDVRTALERLAMGLEQNLGKVIHGNIVSFDPRTLAIVIEYDCSDENQMKDFIFSRVREPIGKSTRTPDISKDGLRLKCGGSYWENNMALKLPLVASGDLKAHVRFAKLTGFMGFSPRLSFYEVFAAYKDKAVSRGSGDTVSYVYGSGKNNSVAQHAFRGHPDGAPADGNGKLLKETHKPAVDARGEFIMERKGNHYSVSYNGKEVLAYTAEKISKRPGLSIGGHSSTEFTLTHLRVECHLALDWLKAQLAAR